MDDELEVSSGMRLDRSGFDSPYYITDTDRLVSSNMLMCVVKGDDDELTNYNFSIHRSVR